MSPEAGTLIDPTDTIPLNFGVKHRGKTPNEIAQTDPRHIVWLYETIPGVVSRDLYLECSERVESADDGWTCFERDEDGVFVGHDGEPRSGR